MDSIAETLKSIKLQEPVNSISKDINPTVNSSTNKESNLSRKISALLEAEEGNIENLSMHIAEMLDDGKSLAYYRLLLENNKQHKVLEAAHITKQASQEGKIRTKKAIYFIGILRKWGFKIRFKKLKKY